MNQLGLFTQEDVKRCELEPKTTVRLGRRAVQSNLTKRRRETWQKLDRVLKQLEGKDILVSHDMGSRGYFHLSHLRLSRLKVGRGRFYRDDQVPPVIILWGSKNACIRIDTRQLFNFREQYGSKGKPYWLIDFWNGFGQSPIDPYKPYGYDSLHIETV